MNREKAKKLMDARRDALKYPPDDTCTKELTNQYNYGVKAAFNDMSYATLKLVEALEEYSMIERRRMNEIPELKGIRQIATEALEQFKKDMSE